ncbi:MAG: beta-propeller domain-containing protein [Deltaproteobacteria bacterium]|nr:beta-propeller domain-containing protein [Deltaproteobacteria bacterium]
MKMFVKYLMIINLSLLTLHCSAQKLGTGPGPINPDPDPEDTVPTSLVKYSNCDDLLADIQAQAIADMEETLDNYSTCGTYYTYDCSDCDIAFPSSDSTSESGVDFTGTNIQEENVDEADIIKTDGAYIYVATDNGVDIFKAWPLSAFDKAGSYADSDGIDSLYLDDNRLIAIGYAHDDTRGSSVTKISVLNIEKPASPVLSQVKEIEGYVAGSRLVNHVVHVAISSSFEYYQVDGLDDLSEERWSDDCSEAELASQIENLKEENRSAIMATTIDDWLPSHGDGTTWEMVACSDFADDTASDEDNLLGLYSLNLEESDEEEMTFVIGYAQEVYASTEAVYLASSNWSADETYIHRFAIGSGDALHTYVASGSVEGHIDNSFSMSEYENTFRIATTIGSVSRDGTSAVSNNVYVLDATDADLPILGKVEGIAEGEEIYAARFIGDKGYLVTYEKIDPLFVVDLSDSENPTIEGELEMPGFSTYLHPLGSDHLIGLGKDADDVGTFSWFQGLKLAVFDVEDGSNPAETENLTIGSRGTDSAALEDHHAFTYDEETGILAIPISLYTGGTGKSDYGDFSYNGVHLYEVTESGIETVAEIELDSDEWYAPERTIMIGDDGNQGLYILDHTHLYLVDMNDDYRVRATEAVDNDDDYGYWVY